MKNYKNEVICSQHRQPITKIDAVSKRLRCAKCDQQTVDQLKNRLELMRAKLESSYTNELESLKNLKTDIEKISDVFLNHNMVDAKRKIKKQLPNVQVLIDNLIDKQVEQANKQLKIYTQKLLKPWASLDNKRFQLAHIQLERAYPELSLQIEQKKKQLKSSIATNVKAELVDFYSKLFNL